MSGSVQGEQPRAVYWSTLWMLHDGHVNAAHRTYITAQQLRNLPIDLQGYAQLSVKHSTVSLHSWATLVQY